ncbi:hypothetical protein D7319_05015 [Streptomyces radicis]|uniref:Aminoglycoside phosphotransferase domain-containing protein n=2 Tax=Streptomyces radicis TaxID=1750517 RepID=A0A3A9WFF2_9ACTN|nr:hypothetical protein D7319_05015 [Streptomyces radicis]RKN26655.1 hypothetical protein D7318_04640 [Streptomyces radicis]
MAARLGVAADAVRPAAFQGVAGEVHLLGADLVLKVARTGFAADLRKEALVVPHAVAAGVRTPEVVEFGAGGPPFGAPYLVLRRAPGVAVAEPGPRARRELGRELALLHAAPVPPEVRAGVPADPVGDPGPGVERLVAEGWLSADLARWLLGWLGALAALAPPFDAPVLIHGDVSAANLLVDPGPDGRLVALLDWGDAALTEPAVEFAKVPMRALPEVLDGYLEGRGESGAAAWAARALWHHVVWAVGAVARGPEPEARHWSAQPVNRLLELVRACAEGLPEGWQALRPPR